MARCREAAAPRIAKPVYLCRFTTYRHRFARAAPAPRAKRKDSKNRGRASPVKYICARWVHLTRCLRNYARGAREGLWLEQFAGNEVLALSRAWVGYHRDKTITSARPSYEITSISSHLTGRCPLSTLCDERLTRAPSVVTLYISSAGLTRALIFEVVPSQVKQK